MNRLNAYLFKQTAAALFFTVTAITLVVLFTQSFRLMSFVIDNSGTMMIFFRLMGLMMLTFLPIVVPLSLGIAVVFTYHKLAVDSELVVMRSAGISPFDLAKPALTLTTLVVLFGYLLTTWITPWAYSELVSTQYKVRDNFSIFLVKSGAFNDVADGLTFYVRDRGKNGELEGILIHDVRSPERPVTIMAENGLFQTDESGTPQIVVFKGRRQEINGETGRLSQLDFDRYVVDLQIVRGGTSNRLADPREMTMTALLTKAINLSTQEKPPSPNEGRLNAPRLWAELHQRLTTPLLAFGFCLIGITSILAGPFNRRGMAKRIVIASLAIVVLQATALSLDNLVTKQMWLAVLLYLSILFPIPICLGILSSDRWFSLPFSIHFRANRLFNK